MQQDGDVLHDTQQQAGDTGFAPASTPSIPNTTGVQKIENAEPIAQMNTSPTSTTASNTTLANLPLPDPHSNGYLSMSSTASGALSIFPSTQTPPSVTHSVVLQDNQALITLYTGPKTPLNKAKKDVLVSLCLLVGGGEESNYSLQTKVQLLDYIEVFVSPPGFVRFLILTCFVEN